MVIFLCNAVKEFDIDNILRVSDLLAEHETDFTYVVGKSHYQQLIASLINDPGVDGCHFTFVYDDTESEELGTDYAMYLARHTLIKDDHFFIVRPDTTVTKEDIDLIVRKDLTCVAAEDSSNIKDKDMLLICGENRRIQAVAVKEPNSVVPENVKVSKGLLYVKKSLGYAIRLILTTYRKDTLAFKVSSMSRTYLLSRLLTRNFGVYPSEIK